MNEMNRSFYAILISQTATNLAYALYPMVIVLHLYHQTGSTGLSATVTLVSMLSRMLSGMALPAVSDRFRPLALLLSSQVFQLIVLSVLVVVISLNFSSMNLIATFVLLSLISFCHGWFSPIKSSLVRAVVPEQERVRAVSLISTVDQTFLFLGWTFGGLMISLIGLDASLAISFGFVLLSALSLLFVRLKDSIVMPADKGLLNRLTSGWKLLYRHSGLRVILVMNLIQSLAGAIWIGAVTLTFVQEALNKGEDWWGYINGAYFLGTIIGGLIIFRLSRFMKGKLSLCMLGGSFIFAIILLAYGMTSNAYLALGLILILGPASQLRDLSEEVMFQNAAESNELTKMLAAQSSLMQLIFILSIVIIGGVTDAVGVRWVYIIAGCLFLAATVYGYSQLIAGRKGSSLEKEAAPGM
jgi:MFS family permease